MLRGELPEPGERHFLLAPQSVGDRVEKGVDGPRGVARRQPRFRGDLVHELLFRQVPLLPSSDGKSRQKRLTGGWDPLNHAVLRGFCLLPAARWRRKATANRPNAGGGPRRPPL